MQLVVYKSHILCLVSQYLFHMDPELSARQRAKRMASISSLESHSLQRGLWAMPIMFRCLDRHVVASGDSKIDHSSFGIRRSLRNRTF
ncbi:hypothetical protein TNCV_4959441 [Trichonephila clavipes]|uniref:Uncharacterized protein n=1 Tax=Trichonephila clavipes TaxID=2585209 RepID=A0A8X6SH42_TRICX|nr:hypothetical protein TNCV_4959441 [Trichonephila clavipes]